MGEFVSAKVRISEAPRRARARAQTSSPGSFRTRLGASWRGWKITSSATGNCWGDQRSGSNLYVVTGVGRRGGRVHLSGWLGCDGCSALAAAGVVDATVGLNSSSQGRRGHPSSAGQEDDSDICRMWWGDSSLDNPAGPSAGQTLDLSFMDLVRGP